MGVYRYAPKTGLTCDYACMDAWLSTSYHAFMTLSPRDLQIIAVLTSFRQLTARHIRAFVFPGNSSDTPCYRALHRLTKLNIIKPIQQKVIGGVNGGAGAYVYVLGDVGRRLTGTEERRGTIDFHAIAIADTVVVLRSLERLGIASLRRYETEPNCWRTVGGVELQPDLYIEVDLSGGRHWVQWIEVDLGTEGIKQVTRKLELYVQAWLNADLDVFPAVVWVTTDDARAKELERAIASLSAGVPRLFAVTTQERLPELYL